MATVLRHHPLWVTVAAPLQQSRQQRMEDAPPTSTANHRLDDDRQLGRNPDHHNRQQKGKVRQDAGAGVR